MLGEQLLRLNAHADMHAATELDTLGFHLLDALCDQVLLHLEVRNAEHQQAARNFVFLVHRDGVPGPVQLLGCRHPGWAGTDHGNRLPGAILRNLGLDPALVPAPVRDRLLDGLDRNGIVIDAEHACGFAWSGTDSTGELRKVIRRMQHTQRFRPASAINQVVPVRDDVVDRAARMAERDAAVHAASALYLERGLLELVHDLTPVVKALAHVAIGRRLALEFHESRDFAHIDLFPVPPKRENRFQTANVTQSTSRQWSE